MAQGGGLGREDRLRLVDLRPLERFEPGGLVEGELREQAKEAPHVGVLGIAPVLPVLVGREAGRVEPHRPGRRLAHLRAARQGDERGGQSIQVETGGPAAELHPAHDISPLVGAAHLQAAFVAPPELQEVVCLEDHVVELQERERLLAVEAELHRLETEHPVDREVPPVLAQEGDVVKGVEPVRVVDHQGRAAVEIEEALEHASDAGDVGLDMPLGQELPALVLSRRVSDLGGAASHEDDGTMAGTLHVPEQHDLDKASDVKGIGRRVEPDVAGDPAGGGGRVQRLEIGALVDVAALDEGAQELRSQGGGRNGHGQGAGKVVHAIERGLEIVETREKEYKVRRRPSPREPRAVSPERTARAPAPAV